MTLPRWLITLPVFASLNGLAVPHVAQAQIDGTIESQTITGSSGAPIAYTVYLPPGYDPNGSALYPVVYHLHGINGAHDGGRQISTVPPRHEDAVSLGLVQPVIIVFPDGYRDSFWADGFDGQVPAESDLVEAIMPDVQSRFRTLSSRGYQIVQGYSMGGFGAAKFASKFPELFGAAVLYDGALLTWEGLLASPHSEVASRVFHGSPAYFDEFSPWAWVERNAAVLAATLPFRQIAGRMLRSENASFYQHLVANGIAPDYVEVAQPHDLSLILDSPDPVSPTMTVGQKSWAFIQSVFDDGIVSQPFVSIPDEDGWIAESSKVSGTGGSVNSAGPGLVVGYTASRQELRAVLSFQASIPDGATIVDARVRLTRVGGAGSTASLGTLRGDIQNGAFGAPDLEPSDFQANATVPDGIPSIPVPAVGATTTVALSAAGRLALNRAGGRTQIRLAFTLDDGAENVVFASSNHANQRLHPVLEVDYR